MRRGFTLVELLVALAVLGWIAALAVAALAPSLAGWADVAEAANDESRMLWLMYRLRTDAALVLPTNLPDTPPIAIENDSRGEAEYDRLALVAATGEAPEPCLIRWFIDEETGHLIREARGLAHAEPWRADFGAVQGFSVEALGEDGLWQSRWGTGGTWAWPKMLRLRLKLEHGEREWLVPVLVERAI